MTPPPAIPLVEPSLGGNEWAYVKECLDTGWVSSVGPFVNRFEAELARVVGVPHAVATVNGTSALHLALLVAGVTPGELVLTSTLTFIAPVNAIRYTGAEPVLVDAEPHTWQMDVGLVEAFLREECERGADGHVRHGRTGRRVAALLPVHVLGHPVDMRRLLPLARAFGLPVIEDATESLGARVAGGPVGALGDAACFSFNGNKLLTTGGGGMLVTSREAWARRARYLSTQAKDDPEEYVHREVGFNYRLTNVLAAIGVAQLEQLEPFLEAKRSIAARYATELAAVDGITTMPVAEWATSAWWMYTIQVDPGAFGMSARDLGHQLAREQIQTRPLWQPMHRSAAHPGATVLGGEVADALYARGLSLPCSVGLSAGDQDRVIAAIRAAAPRRPAPASTTGNDA